MKLIIQVAGIKDQKEQEHLYEDGVRWFGYPYFIYPHMPENTLSQLQHLLALLPDDAVGVWIHYLRYARAILPLVDYLKCTAIQCHGAIDAGELALIKKSRPDLVIIKSLVIGLQPLDALLQEVKESGPYVDYFITDTYDALTGCTGATGLTHDWQKSKAIVAVSKVPVILAGGLNDANVYEAILDVKPAGVDAHTGLERMDGYKCREKVRAFIKRSEAAFAECYRENK